jgi:hypothetical protein
MGDRVLVLDLLRNEIVIFKETAYGKLINEATALRFGGDEVLAVDKWREVLKINANFELANVGIGKAYLAAGENRIAMHYLRLGMNRIYYSLAFRRYRNEILKENLGWILTVGLTLIVGGYVALQVYKRRKRGADTDWGGDRYE